MIKTTVLLSALAGSLLLALPANAQQRVFVSGAGNDANPCSLGSPCRSFQHAHDVVTANGEIDVLDPAGYGAVTITKSISIQAHGFGGITQISNSGHAITVSAGPADAVTLNGLLIDGAGTGNVGIDITSGGAVQIVDCVVRHFNIGIFLVTTTNPADLLVSNTVASDNAGSGIIVQPQNGSPALTVSLNAITANNNATGVSVLTNAYVMIAHSVMSNNSANGLFTEAGATWLNKSTISGNGSTGVSGTGGVYVNGGPVNSYRNNYINSNINNDVFPANSLTSATPR